MFRENPNMFLFLKKTRFRVLCLRNRCISCINLQELFFLCQLLDELTQALQKDIQVVDQSDGSQRLTIPEVNTIVK
jgi:hypothetical protein